MHEANISDMDLEVFMYSQVHGDEKIMREAMEVEVGFEMVWGDMGFFGFVDLDTHNDRKIEISSYV